jgi:hypothetical protein
MYSTWEKVEGEVEGPMDMEMDMLMRRSQRGVWALGVFCRWILYMRI